MRFVLRVSVVLDLEEIKAFKEYIEGFSIDLID